MKYLVFSLFLLFVTSCATVAPPEDLDFEIPRGQSVVIFNFLTDEIVHAYAGPTIFNNSIETYTVDWELPEFVESKVEEIFSESGHQVLNNIMPDEIRKSVKDLYERGWYGRRIKEDKKGLIRSLSDDYGVDILVVLKPISARAPEANIELEGYGLYTRSFVVSFTRAIAYIDITTILTEQVQDITYVYCRIKCRNRAGRSLKDFAPNTNRELMENEIDNAEVFLKEYLEYEIARNLTLLVKHTK